MDTTVRGIPMEEEHICQVILDLLQIDVEDGIQFVFEKMEPIREDDAYNNFRVCFLQDLFAGNCKMFL